MPVSPCSRPLTIRSLTALAARMMVRHGYDLNPPSLRPRKAKSASDADMRHLCGLILARIGREHACHLIPHQPIAPTDLPASHMGRLLAKTLSKDTAP